MGSAEEYTSYEEVRNKNVERNLDVMRILGLIPPRCEGKQETERTRFRKPRIQNREQQWEPRRSARVATFVKASEQMPDKFSGGFCPLVSRTKRSALAEGSDVVFKKKVQEASGATAEEVAAMEKEMDQYNNVQDGYNTDRSSDSLYAVEANMNLENRKSVHDNVLVPKTVPKEVVTTSGTLTPNSSNIQVGNIFGIHFQELVMRAVMQSTMSLFAPPPPVMSVPTIGSAGSPMLSIEGVCSANTWNEATYNLGQARRKKETLMTRTSAGEGSDSQEDFLVTENESPQQRSVRTRRLNRSRSSRAKDLTSNRKALKKLPYVIHVDGMAKAKGIHKHLWRAAVRGQCGRLDPTMDNINHHPKHVVDSIWHALEGEWEFEGVFHRAREIFEKSATKFMRNKKMQLKYKSLKNRDGKKPDDVSDIHWSKIVDLTNKGKQQNTFTSSRQSIAKGKDPLSGTVNDNMESVFPELKMEHRSESWSRDEHPMRSDSFALDEVEVDAEIRTFKDKLLKLQKSKKVQDSAGSSGANTVGELVIVDAGNTVFDDMKENIMPQNRCTQQQSQGSSGTTRTAREKHRLGKGKSTLVVNKSFQVEQGVRDLHECESIDDINEKEMDCGDVVRLFAFTEGRKEEIGKGIVMGLAGSKYAKKGIPKGWRSIKVTSCTSTGASKVCPFPTGWIEQLKSETVHEANGRTILWPNMLLHSLVHM